MRIDDEDEDGSLEDWAVSVRAERRTVHSLYTREIRRLESTTPTAQQSYANHQQRNAPKSASGGRAEEGGLRRTRQRGTSFRLSAFLRSERG
eukprot:1456646-Prymnesium_polylepis.2